jgi:light-regulated signal transduction histidine kinase (bacteriophytochrome)
VHTAITNISKLKQAHAVAQDIDREQEKFTQSIADHLRTPLVTISNFSRTILQEHATELSAELKDIIERMECAAVRTEATLQHLLEYCCLGYEPVALDPVNLEELMQQVIIEHRATLQHHRAELTIDRPLPCVRGARLLLAQVIANVLTNTLKHTKPDGTPRIRISAERIKEEIVLKISDEGTPLETTHEEEQNFQVFERRREKDCYWGAGIGLAIVRRTIERMHGRVWVDSGAGKANCFYIGLPAV